MRGNEAWDQMIAEIMRKDVADMDYDELTKVTMAYRDDEEVGRWSDRGDDYYEMMEETYESKYGITYPLRKDAPDKAKEAYKRLSEIELKATEKGVIIQ